MLAVAWASRREPMGLVLAFVAAFLVASVVASAAAVVVVAGVAAVAGVVVWMSRVWVLLHLCRLRMRL
jgi:hypothetical protein